MKHLTTALLATLIASSLTVSACATKPDRREPPQDGQRGQGERGGDKGAKSSGTFMIPIAALFADMDSNNDRRTSTAEMRAGAASEWAGFGQSPGAIYFSDWSLKTLGSTDARPTFMSFDTDFSGVISETEFSDRIEKAFTRMDKNKDGFVDRSEMLIVYAAPRTRSEGRGERGGRRGGGRGQGGGRPSR